MERTQQGCDNFPGLIWTEKVKQMTRLFNITLFKAYIRWTCILSFDVFVMPFVTEIKR